MWLSDAKDWMWLSDAKDWMWLSDARYRKALWHNNAEEDGKDKLGRFQKSLRVALPIHFKWASPLLWQQGKGCQKSIFSAALPVDISSKLWKRHFNAAASDATLPPYLIFLSIYFILELDICSKPSKRSISIQDQIRIDFQKQKWTKWHSQNYKWYKNCAQTFKRLLLQKRAIVAAVDSIGVQLLILHIWWLTLK